MVLGRRREGEGEGGCRGVEREKVRPKGSCMGVEREKGRGVEGRMEGSRG